MPAGKKEQEMGKGIIKYENHVALGCLLGSILFQHLSLNQDHQTRAVVLAMPHSPDQLPWLGDTGGKESFAWQAREHPIRQDKHLNTVTAMVLPSASEEPAECFVSPHTASELNTIVAITPISLNPAQYRNQLKYAAVTQCPSYQRASITKMKQEQNH